MRFILLAFLVALVFSAATATNSKWLRGPRLGGFGRPFLGAPGFVGAPFAGGLGLGAPGFVGAPGFGVGGLG